MPSLPGDAVLLPLTRGRLLVSSSQATFCRVPPEHVACVERALDGDVALPEPLAADLERHGFFGPPRAAAPAGRTVQLQLTNACNLRCAYCCTNSGSPRAVELDRVRWLALVDEIHAVTELETGLAILGGEPFLNPWAIELAERIASLGRRLSVFTNATTLVSNGLAQRVAALMRAGAKVRVSLAGPTRETCDGVSRAPRFDQVIAAIHELARHGAAPLVDLMLLPEHVDATCAGLPALRALLPAGTTIAVGLLFPGGREDGARVFASRSALEQSLDRIVFEAGETIAAPAARPVADRREGCSCALGHHLHVRSDGALFNCFKMEERVGDLRAERFSDVYARVRCSPRPAATLPRCAACPLATLCGGGCRSENLQLSGSADEPACGPWRVRVLSELLAEDRVTALEWPAHHLLSEAHARGIEAPPTLVPRRKSLHLLET